MAENVTLARPYAEAAFALARNEDGLPAWADALERMAAVASRSEMKECLANPRIAVGQVTQLFLEVVGNLDVEQQNFVRMLIENRRAAQLTEIHALFMQLKNQYEGIKDAHVYSAFPLDDATLGNLKSDLEARFGRLKINISIDPELIGGVRVAVGDEVIDASVKGKLAAMAAMLQN